MKGRGKINTVLAIVLVASLALLFFENISAITGHATDAQTTSNVTIMKYLSIQMSPELQSGIKFEDIITLPTVDDNATENYAGAGNSSLYYIQVSNDSNTAVDFCLMANSGMINEGGAVIGLDNETYSAINTTSDAINPDIALQTPMTTSYVRAVNDTSIGGEAYFRFWLDVPAGQETGQYNNSVSFRGINRGQVSC